MAASWNDDQSGYQFGRTGLGFTQSVETHASPSVTCMSMDEKVSSAEAKMKDFMAEIASLEEPAEESVSTNVAGVAGFVSAGHILTDQSEAQKADDVEQLRMTLQKLVEPVAQWQHLLDENTQHYYYWNTQTNAVTWTMPPDYSDYLVQMKVYQETKSALEAKMKTAEKLKQDEETMKQNVDEIGPQLPIKPSPNIAGPAQSVTSTAGLLVGYGGEESEDASDDGGDKPAIGLVPYNNVEDKEVDNSAINVTHDTIVSNTLTADTVEVPSETEKGLSSANMQAVGSLVAYGDSFVEDDDDDDNIEETGSHVQLYPCPSQSAIAVTTETNDSKSSEQPTMDIQMYEAIYEGPLTSYDDAMYTQMSADAPLLFTAPPPPPPPPPDDESKETGLSSVQISECASVITDKLHFLDVSTENVTKLQFLLIQLKTRLDDWQAGGLDKGYLVEKIQEFDNMIESCEAGAAPAGFRCCWCSETKQYFFTHEITDEVTWTYPEEDKRAVLFLAERKNKESKVKVKPGGTLANVSSEIANRTVVDPALAAFFMKKVVEKCGAKPEENSLESKLNVTELVDEQNGHDGLRYSHRKSHKPKRKHEGSDHKSKRRKHSKKKKHKSSRHSDTEEEGEIHEENHSPVTGKHRVRSKRRINDQELVKQTYDESLSSPLDDKHSLPSTPTAGRQEIADTPPVQESDSPSLPYIDQLVTSPPVPPPEVEPPPPPSPDIPPLPNDQEIKMDFSSPSPPSQTILAPPSLRSGFNVSQQIEAAPTTALNAQLSSFYAQIEKEDNSPSDTALSQQDNNQQSDQTVEIVEKVSSISKKEKSKKDKTSKRTTKKSRMPSALVQKWQKVQNEVEDEIMKEKRIMEEILQ